MNKFEKQLEKWNNGILRGAQAKLAKCLQVTTATVALWATGKRHPSKGYIAKMASLFRLNESDVKKLFFPSDTYVPEIFPIQYRNFSLRDSAASPKLYGISVNNISSENSVSLPVFSKLPDNYPHLLTGQARAWWHIPKEFAPKTKFLFSLPTQQDPGRLLFIQPCNTWKPNRNMLGKKGNLYLFVRVLCKDGQIVLQENERKEFSPKTIIPVGIILKQVVQTN